MQKGLVQNLKKFFAEHTWSQLIRMRGVAVRFTIYVVLLPLTLAYSLLRSYVPDNIPLISGWAQFFYHWHTHLGQIITLILCLILCLWGLANKNFSVRHKLLLQAMGLVAYLISIKLNNYYMMTGIAFARQIFLSLVLLRITKLLRGLHSDVVKRQYLIKRIVDVLAVSCFLVFGLILLSQSHNDLLKSHLTFLASCMPFKDIPTVFLLYIWVLWGLALVLLYLRYQISLALLVMALFAVMINSLGSVPNHYLWAYADCVFLLILITTLCLLLSFLQTNTLQWRALKSVIHDSKLAPIRRYVHFQLLAGLLLARCLMVLWADSTTGDLFYWALGGASVSLAALSVMTYIALTKFSLKDQVVSLLWGLGLPAILLKTEWLTVWPHPIVVYMYGIFLTDLVVVLCSKTSIDQKLN